MTILAATHAISQDAAGPESHNPHPVITAISVAERADGVEVKVALTALVHAQVSALEHPDRLVFDFPGCDLAHPGQRLTVNRGLVLAVRAAEFSIAPPIARVVIDLKSAQNHEETYVGNNLIIKLNSQLNSELTAKPNPTVDTPLPVLPSGEAKATASGPPLVPKPERMQPQPAASAPPKPKADAPPPSLSARAATTQAHAYGLFDKARALTLFDLGPLETKARAGDPESETTLALAYHAGALLKQDDAEALRLLRQAANRDFVGAEEAMGIFCQSGFGMPPDKAQAVSWYTKAAQQGSIDAATNLALMYSTGDGIPKEFGQGRDMVPQRRRSRRRHRRVQSCRHVPPR